MAPAVSEEDSDDEYNKKSDHEFAPFDAWPPASALEDRYHKEYKVHAEADIDDKYWDGTASSRWDEQCGWSVFDREYYAPVQQARSDTAEAWRAAQASANPTTAALAADESD